MNRPFDLHVHSRFSDGTENPRDIVRAAKEAGLAFLALTDHDTAAGVPEALAAGEEFDLPVLPGVEFDARFPCQLHMLGLGLELENPALQAALHDAEKGRQERNAAILDKLAALGKDARPFMQAKDGTVTRLNIANALIAGGFAQTRKEVFTTLIGKDCPAFVEARHKLSPEELIALIHGANGLAVLAHPCKLNANVPKIIRGLAAAGLDGLEAYYPTATPGQKLEHLALARELRLLVTCGSDFHGANRPAATLGCAYENSAPLEACRERIMALL